MSTKTLVAGSIAGALLLPFWNASAATALSATVSGSSSKMVGAISVAPTTDEAPPTVALGGEYSYQLVTAPPDRTVVEAAVHPRTPLPAGLSLTNEGVLRGTISDPSFLGKRSVNVEACLSANPAECSVTAVELSVLQPGVADAELPVAGQQASYDHQIASTPVGTVTSITAEGLPPGLSMTPDGLISGVVEVDGGGVRSFPAEFSFEGIFDDANGSKPFSGKKTLDLRVDSSHVVEKQIVTLKGNTPNTEAVVRCPSSQPWVRQTVQAPVADKLEYPEHGWVNAFPGLNWLNNQDHTSVSNPQLDESNGMWGVKATVSQPWWVSLTRSVELRLHCTNDPIYDPSRIDVSGVPAKAVEGKPYEFQLTVVGQKGTNTRILTSAAKGLPAGLTIDATGKITGVPREHRTEGFTITTPLVSDYVAVPVHPASQSPLPSAPYPSFETWRITGNPAPATYGQRYDYQMTIEGDDQPRVVEVNGLPSGLTMDESGKITGTAIGDTAGNHNFSVRLANDHIADPRPIMQFTISMARNSWIDDGNFYHEVIFDRSISGGTTLGWQAQCPTAFPYLSKTAGADGRAMGYGVNVRESGGVVVMESLDLGREYQTSPNGYRYVVKNSGTMTSFNGTQSVKLEMVCTSSLSHGWSERD